MSSQQQILLVKGGLGVTVPVNTVAPSISGTFNVGQTVTCTTGSWTQSPSSYSYQWKSNGSNVGSNSPSYLLAGTDTGNTITCTVTATNVAGSGTPAVSNTSSAVTNIGQQAYTTAGSYTWTCPDGVTSVSVLTVGAGTGHGGALSYKNNISVTPGVGYSVLVGGATPESNFNGTGVVSAGVYTTRTGDGGGNGGYNPNVQGGGAGGYSGNGGSTPGGVSGNGSDGAGGGGGGGGVASTANPYYVIGGGGGVGLLGEGSSGAGGVGADTYAGFATAYGGAGGSSGSTGGNSTGNTSASFTYGAGGNYGGGAGKANGTFGTIGGGAVRIIWPGTTRQFPSTSTADM